MLLKTNKNPTTPLILPIAPLYFHLDTTSAARIPRALEKSTDHLESSSRLFKWLEELILSNRGIFAGFGAFLWVLVKASAEMMLDFKQNGISHIAGAGNKPQESSVV